MHLQVYSEDPALSGFMTYMFVNGGQVGNESNPKFMQAAACCKHYAAYDLETIPVDRHHFSAKVRRILVKLDLHGQT